MGANQAVDEYITQANILAQTVFVEAPGCESEWNLEQKRLFQKYVKKRRNNYVPFTYNGTTFSGDPHTTLGNTLRSLFYAFYYLRDLHPTPWDNSEFFIMAAGDDVVVLCRT